MKKGASLLLAAAVGVGAFAATRNASALGPVDLEIGAKVGGATNPSSSDGPNALGFGLGARAGVSFMNVYGGVSFMYYFGGSTDLSVPGIAGSEHVSGHSILYGVEGGYNLSLPIITLRPQLGIGNFTLSQSIDIPGATTPDVNNIYLEPGVTALITVGTWYIGADANLLFLPGLDGSQTAFTVHGQVGFKL